MEDFRKKLEELTKSKENFITENVDFLNEYVVDNSELPDELLVSLIIYHKSGKIHEDFKKDMKLYKLIDEKCQVTDKAKEIIENKETVEKVKRILSESK